MKKRIEHKHKNDEERIVERFTFLPLTLNLPKEKQTPSCKMERRWFERVKILQRYWMYGDGIWVNSEWVD